MLWLFVVVFNDLAMVAQASSCSILSNPCHRNGDSSNCTSYIQMCLNLSLEQLEKDRNRVKDLIRSKKIRHNINDIPFDPYNVAMSCFAIGRVPIDGECNPCPKNCEHQLDKDVCDFFCNRPNVQSTSAIQTTPTSTSALLNDPRGASFAPNATLTTSQSTSSPPIANSIATTDRSNLFVILACIIIIVVGIILFVMACLFFRRRVFIWRLHKPVHANGGVAFYVVNPIYGFSLYTIFHKFFFCF